MTKRDNDSSREMVEFPSWRRAVGEMLSAKARAGLRLALHELEEKREVAKLIIKVIEATNECCDLLGELTRPLKPDRTHASTTMAVSPAAATPAAPPVVAPEPRKISGTSLVDQVLACFERHGGTATVDLVKREVYGGDGQHERTCAQSTLGRMKTAGLVRPLGDKRWELVRRGDVKKRVPVTPSVPKGGDSASDETATNQGDAPTRTQRLLQLLQLYGGRVDQGLFAKALYKRDKPEYRRNVRDLIRNAVKTGHVRRMADGLYKRSHVAAKASAGRAVPSQPEAGAGQPPSPRVVAKAVPSAPTAPTPSSDEPKWKRALDLLHDKPRDIATIAQRVYGANTTRNRQTLRSMLLALQREGKRIREVSPGVWGPADTDGPPASVPTRVTSERLKRPRKVDHGSRADDHAGGKSPPMYRCRATGCGALKFEGQLVAHLVEDHGRLDLAHATKASEEVRSHYELRVDTSSPEDALESETAC